MQICTSSRRLHPNSEQFKGLKDITTYTTTDANGRQTFVYTHGSATSYAAITTIQTKIREKFADCFIVVFKDGERVSGEEANAAKKKQP